MPMVAGGGLVAEGAVWSSVVVVVEPGLEGAARWRWFW